MAINDLDIGMAHSTSSQAMCFTIPSIAMSSSWVIASVKVIVAVEPLIALVMASALLREGT